MITTPLPTNESRFGRQMALLCALSSVSGRARYWSSAPTPNKSVRRQYLLEARDLSNPETSP